MLDRLVDALIQFIDLFKVVRIVHQYQRAVLMRRGIYVRTLKPGWHFTWPLAIDEVISENVVTDTTRTRVQHLTTADGVNVAVSMVVTWRVVNVKKLLLAVEGRETAMLDAATGSIAGHVCSVHWSDLRTQETLDTLRTDIGARARRWGIKLEDATWHDLIRCDTYALLGAQLSSPAS